MSSTTHNPINQLREDAIFTSKVKRVLVDHRGVMALLTLLQEFKQLRNSKSSEKDYYNECKQKEKENKRCNEEEEEEEEQHQESLYIHSTDQRQGDESSNNYEVTDIEFTDLLRRHGVELTHFEERYLCNAFKKCNNSHNHECDVRKNIRKHVPHYICDKTFIRHLTNVNPRRKNVLDRAWRGFVEQFAKLNNSTANVEHDCTNTLCASAATATTTVAAADASPIPVADRCTIRNFDNRESETAAPTLSTAHNAFMQTITPYLSCCDKEVEQHCEDTNNVENDYVDTAVLDRDEFDAIWAGVSMCVINDNVFEQLVETTFDMNKVHRTSNANSLVVNKEGNIHCTHTTANCGQTYYVKDALDHTLGVSTRSYNYTHMLRKFPFIPLLPPLDRRQIMMTTVQRVYTPFTSEADVKLADPLYSRRGQEM